MDFEDDGWDNASEASFEEDLEADNSSIPSTAAAQSSASASSVFPGAAALGQAKLPDLHGASAKQTSSSIEPVVGAAGQLPLSGADGSNASGAPSDGVFLDLSSRGDQDLPSQPEGDASRTDEFMRRVNPSHHRPNPRFEKYKEQLLQSCRRDLARQTILSKLSAAQALHRSHLSMMLASLVQRSSASCNPALQSVLLSSMPARLLASSQRRPIPGVSRGLTGTTLQTLSLNHIGTLTRWFGSQFEAVGRGSGPAAPPAQHVATSEWLLGLAMQPLPQLSIEEQRAMQSGTAVRRRKPAAPADFVQLFTASIRAMGVPCRLALMADPFDVAGFMQGKVAQARQEAAEATKRAKIERNESTREIEIDLLGEVEEGAGAGAGTGAAVAASTSGTPGSSKSSAKPGTKRGRPSTSSSQGRQASKRRRSMQQQPKPADQTRICGLLALGSRTRQAEQIVMADFQAASRRASGRSTSEASNLTGKHTGSSGGSRSGAKGASRKSSKLVPSAMPAWRRLLPHPNRPQFMQELASAGVVRWWVEVLAHGPSEEQEESGGRQAVAAAAASSSSAGLASSGGNARASSGASKPRWVFVDPIRQLVDTPLVAAALRAKSDPVQYVLAASGSGRLTDVTRRYALSWPESKLAREKCGVGPAEVAALLRAFEPPGAHPQPSHRGRQQDGSSHRHALRTDLTGIDAAEAQELKRAEESVPIPTSVQGFRRHAAYALEGQLLRNQVVRPGAKSVTLFKGKAVYRRRDIAECLSKDKWMQLHARVVKQDQLGSPAAVVMYKPRHKKSAAAEAEDVASGKASASKAGPQPDAEGRIPLPHFGEWQTEAYQPPRIANGIVPKNDFGNVELWNDKCMPIGCAEVDHPLAAKAAASLRVDYAKAFRGFVRKKGQPLPDIRGIVVAKEHQDMVQLGAIELQAEKDRKAAEKRSKQMVKRWEKLVHKALLRSRLRSDYGEGGAAALLPRSSGAASGKPAAARKPHAAQAKGIARGDSKGTETASSGPGEQAEISARLVDNSAKLSALQGMLSEANTAQSSGASGGAQRAAVDSDEDEDDDDDEDEDEIEDGAGARGASQRMQQRYEDFDASSPLGSNASSSSSSSAGVGPSSRQYEEL